jgi:hypothetical protein
MALLTYGYHASICECFYSIKEYTHINKPTLGSPKYGIRGNTDAITGKAIYLVIGTMSLTLSGGVFYHKVGNLLPECDERPLGQRPEIT